MKKPSLMALLLLLSLHQGLVFGVPSHFDYDGATPTHPPPTVPPGFEPNDFPPSCDDLIREATSKLKNLYEQLWTAQEELIALIDEVNSCRDYECMFELSSRMVEIEGRIKAFETEIEKAAEARRTILKQCTPRIFPAN